jgi:4-amino-4-deoxy-L-arabinose transferase-like glycosyltransferase
MVQPDQVLVQDAHRVPLWRSTTAILLLILLLAAFLRLFKLGQSPPGLNQDEAANAWNAYCLFETGKDQAGVSWPVFYTRGLGGNSSTLYIYFMMPFQAVGGLNIFTTRLPGAVAGIFTVLLVYLVGKRLFDRYVGLTAAMLLALNPWHLQQSRWGHEATLGPLLGIAPLAMLLWANMPISDNKTGEPRPLLAMLAGAVAGIGCYGYHSVRIFIPVFLLAIVLLTIPRWRRCIRTRKGALAVAALILGFAVFFGPLLWEHVFHPDGISRHGIAHIKAGVYLGDAPLDTAVKSILSRYIRHFGPEFLFVRGDHRITQSPPGSGQFYWYMLPLMLAGLIFILRFFKSSASARVTLAFVIAYPVGDSLFRTVGGMHALRSAPGLCGLVLLAAAGAVAGARCLWKFKRSLAVAAAAALVTVAVVLNVRHFYRFYVKYNQIPEIYYSFHADLVEACRWLRPRFDKAEAVFCTTERMNMPYIITLVTLGYDPQQWFRDPHRFETIGEYDYCYRYGKMYFVYDSSSLQAFSALEQSSPRGPIFLIVRPGEFHFGRPIHRIIDPEGKDALLIYEL